MIRTQVCILANWLNAIGGIETFVYNWCGMMKDKYKIVVAVTHIDDEQAKRLKRIVEVVPNTTPIECDDLIVMHIGTKTITQNIKYKRKIQMIHGCKSAEYIKSPQADLIVPVSEAVIKSFGDDWKDENVKAILNPINELGNKKTLKLVSCTRLTKEKGYNRMVKLANQLRANGIPYVWFVLTSQKKVDTDLFTPIPPMLDIENIVSLCDYLVQLSDTESFCYSIVESLNLHVPVICTPIEPLDEIGVKDGVNAYVLPFDMENIDVQKIYENKLVFDYEYNNINIKKQWMDILGEAKPFKKYIYRGDEKMKIEVTKKFKDLENGNQLRNVGEIYDCKKERADLIVSKGYAKYCSIDAYVPKEEIEEVPFEEEIKEEFVPTAEEISDVEEVIEEKPKKKPTKKTTKKKSDK